MHNLTVTQVLYARRILHDLLSYSHELEGLETTTGPMELMCTAAELAPVIAVLEAHKLVEAVNDRCRITQEGLDFAQDEEKLDTLFPVAGNPLRPLPGELRYGGRPFLPAENPPTPWGWESYEKHVTTAWQKLLSRGDQSNEAIFQRFLERNPCLLPEPYSCFARGAHIIGSAVYSQPVLPAYRGKRPDFMWLAFDSGAVFALLIDIEAPSKRWHTQTGVPKAEFIQAREQLTDWRAWFEQPENLIAFQKLYRIEPRLLEGRQFSVKYALVYGRRSEATKDPMVARKRGVGQRPDEVFMTYDRLEPMHRTRACATIALDSEQPSTRFRVVSIPPTFELSPTLAYHLESWAGLEDAMKNCRLLGDERREFLIFRAQYWRDWAREPEDAALRWFERTYYE